MNSKKIILAVLLLLNISCIANAQTITNNVPPLSEFSGEMVSKIKLAKDYYMTSPDPDAGRTFEERTANLSNKIKVLFQNFKEIRSVQYQNVRFVFSGSDWATGKHTPKTVNIESNVYVFYKMVRTMNGDWKGGPRINGIDRSGWFEGDIPGGSVHWVTGGHGRASTKWTIDAKYASEYIQKVISNEEKSIKKDLHALNLPTD